MNYLAKIHTWLQRLLRHGSRKRSQEIIVTDTGFIIVHNKGMDAVRLEEVNEIIAYKIDAVVTDLVCCNIVTGAGDSQQIRTIHEELPGFDALMDRFETLPGFNAKWRDAIILPPFATNETIIYNRADYAGTPRPELET